ncbi:MAG: hypothetical protein AUI33_09200, partial [Ignavibacteria bacterium 13_1_40CM_2_61_4]
MFLQRLSVAALLTSLACASTPKQAIELSATVGRDLAAVHDAHVALAKRYFDRMDADVNSFVDQTYRPFVIERSIRNFKLLDRIVHPLEGTDAVDIMRIFVDSITRDIEQYRADLLRPIRAQRDKVFTSLEDAYRRIQDGNSVITGHLASLVAVQDAQDQALAEAGLQGIRERLVDASANASDQLTDLVRK